MEIIYKNLTERELDIFIEMRIHQTKKQRRMMYYRKAGLSELVECHLWKSHLTLDA